MVFYFNKSPDGKIIPQIKKPGQIFTPPVGRKRVVDTTGLDITDQISSKDFAQRKLDFSQESMNKTLPLDTLYQDAINLDDKGVYMPDKESNTIKDIDVTTRDSAFEIEGSEPTFMQKAGEKLTSKFETVAIGAGLLTAAGVVTPLGWVGAAVGGAMLSAGVFLGVSKALEYATGNDYYSLKAAREKEQDEYMKKREAQEASRNAQIRQLHDQQRKSENNFLSKDL